MGQRAGGDDRVWHARGYRVFVRRFLRERIVVEIGVRIGIVRAAVAQHDEALHTRRLYPIDLRLPAAAVDFWP